MSRSRKTPRQPMDFYQTPPHYLDALATYIDFSTFKTVFEPCVGNGAIADYLTDVCGLKKVYTNDIDPMRAAWRHFDAAYEDNWPGRDWDLSITNPPFGKLIARILRQMLTHSTNTITLGRLSLLEPTKMRRQLFMDFGDPSMVIVLPRYKFTNPSKDTMTCAWFGWGPDVPQITTVWTEEPPK